jgi:hypothetical protein
MSISYEDALATLQSMFGEPWTRETLDAVLRHEKGHMENTCDRILQHGDQSPQLLVDRLKANGPEPQVAMDEQLARQLAAGGSTARRSSTSSSRKGRGTPTTLPGDFLRLPGYKPSGGATSSSAGGMMDDETLARMLQDELFSEELARNPDFAHLARGGGRGRTNGSSSARRTTTSNARIPASTPNNGNPFEGANVMQKISGTYRLSLRVFSSSNKKNYLNGSFLSFLFSCFVPGLVCWFWYWDCNILRYGRRCTSSIAVICCEL